MLFPQVEFHPKLLQTELRKVCEEYGVCFQAYSSLGKGELVTDPVVLEIAKNCERTPGQVNPQHMSQPTMTLFVFKAP